MDKSVNKSHPKATSAEEKAKQHLISVGLYGRSVSIISNAFRLTSIYQKVMQKSMCSKNLTYPFLALYGYVGIVGLGRS